MAEFPPQLVKAATADAVKVRFSSDTGDTPSPPAMLKRTKSAAVLQAAARGRIVRRELSNELIAVKRGHYVRVSVRVRPLGEGRGEHQGLVRVDASRGTITVADQGKFSFESVYDSEDNAALFASVGTPLVEAVLVGYNATLFAYGQTGSGKTYTIGELSKLGTAHEGVAHRMARALYEPPPEHLRVLSTTVRVQYLQIHLEKVYDLFAPADAVHAPMQLREDKTHGVHVVGAASTPAPTISECISLIKKGSANLKFAATQSLQSRVRTRKWLPAHHVLV